MGRTRHENARLIEQQRSAPPRGRGGGRGIRPLALGVAAGLVAALAVAAPAYADVEFVDAPTRLYLLPNAAGPLPAPIPFPVVPDGVLLFDDSTDLISQDLRKIEVVSEETDCVFGEDYDLTGCTAVQLDVTHGLLDFTTAPTRIEYDAENDGTNDDVVYELPGGALVRDMDSDDDLPALATAVIGTTDQVNAALDLLRYTPDADYFYDGSNPETLSVDIVPGSGAGSLTQSVDIRVQDLNDFPAVAVPSTVYAVAPGDEVVLAPPAAWEVTDDDNDEPDGDGTLDGPGEEFIVVAWASCGYFHFQGASGMALRDDLEEVIAYALDLDPAMDPAWRQTIIDAFLAVIPDDVEALPFATGNPNEYATAFAGVTDDLDWLNYHLDEITFAAVTDPATMTPLADTLCDVRFLVTDIGNNGLPLQYLGDPPEGIEVPFFGFDVDTNDAPAVELVQVQVGDGQELEVSLADETVPEGSTGAVTATVSPADHPGFDLTVSTADGPDAVAGADYTALTDVVVTVPAGAGTVDIPVDAIQDAEYEQPDETYLLTATAPVTDPPGYQVTMTDASAVVTIDDDDPLPDTTDPTVTIDQAVAQPDPATTLAPVLFTADFDEPVTGFDGAGDVDVTFTGTGTPVATIVAVDSEVYTVSVSGMTSGGVLTASIPSGAAQDAAANPSAASTSTDNTVTIAIDDPDDVPPTVAIDQAVGQIDPATTLDPVMFTAVFDEDVTGFDAPADVDLAFTGSGTVAATIVPVDPQTYSVSVTGHTSGGILTATIPAGVAVDLAGNANAASTSTDNTVTVTLGDPIANDPPVLTVTATASTPPNTPVAVPASGSDPDVAAGTMEIEIDVSAIGGSVTAGGTFTWPHGSDVTSDLFVGTLAEVNSALSALVFTPGQGQTGVARLVIELDDQGNTGTGGVLSDTAFTLVTIASDGDPDPEVNDPPVLTLAATATTPMDTPLGIPASVADPDVGGGTMDIEIDVAAINGTTVTADGTFAWPAGVGVTSDTFTGTLAEVNAALSSVVFTPAAGGTGIARLVLEIDDNGNSGTGGERSHTRFIDIEITDVDEIPLTIAVPDDIVVDAPPGEPGTVVTFDAPTTSGGVPPVTVECDHASGDVYAIGVTTVTCTATDSAPEEIVLFAVVSDSFTITVNATEDPGTGPQTPGPAAGPALPPTGALPAIPVTAATVLLLAGAAALRVARRRRAAALSS